MSRKIKDLGKQYQERKIRGRKIAKSEQIAELLTNNEINTMQRYRTTNLAMICAIKSNKQSNVQFSVNRNFALSCVTSFNLTNKQAIGQKAFKRYVGLHVINI